GRLSVHQHRNRHGCRHVEGGQRAIHTTSVSKLSSDGEHDAARQGARRTRSEPATGTAAIAARLDSAMARRSAKDIPWNSNADVLPGRSAESVPGNSRWRFKETDQGNSRSSVPDC